MSAYSDKVIADGAIAYWRLNELSGTTANSLVGSYPGTISGGVTLNQPGALGDGDKAMRFPGDTGIDQGILIAGLPALSLWSMEGWFISDGIPTNTLRCVSYAGGSMELEVSPANDVMFFDGTHTAAAPLKLLPAQPYLHLVMTYDGSAIRIYSNGALGYTGAGRGRAVTAGAIGIGRYYTSASVVSFKGSIDEVAIYPTALTPRQIADHYAAASLPAPGAAPYAPVVLPAAKPPHTQWTPITPSDIVDSPFSALWVGGAGTVAAVGLDGRVVTFAGVQAGTRLRISGRRVNDTATTATALLALGRT